MATNNSHESQPLVIRVKPIPQKAQKGKLPRRLGRKYPPRIPAVFMTETILERLLSYASSDTDMELGGVLVGKIGKTSRRLFLEVLDFIPASKGISRRASFEFTNEAQQEIHDVKESRFADLSIIGWFHTHPGYGIFLSSADDFIDRNYFKEKYHIAIVIDPCQEEPAVGVFVWNKGARMRVPYFHPKNSR